MIVLNEYSSDPRVRREAEALVERGDSVDCICLQSYDRVKSLRGVRLFGMSGKYRGRKRIRHLAAYFRFFCFAFLKVSALHFKNAYDIVQVHTMPDFLVFTAVLPKLFGAKIVLDIHDLMPELYMAKFGGDYKSWVVRIITFIERRSVAFADRTIAVHEPHLDILTKHGNPRDKFSVLLNVPDDRIFVHTHVLRKESTFRLVYHGTIPDSDRAGLAVALRALSLIRTDLKRFQLRIIGNGAGIEALRSLAHELDLDSYVEFMGLVPVERVPGLLSDAAVGLVPYAADAFTHYVLPTKLLEYAVLRIPVIVSRLRAIQAHFSDDMVGFFEPGNEIDLAEQILRLYRNPDVAARLASNAAKFTDKYKWQQHREVYFRLIDSLLPATAHVLSNAS